MRAPGKSAPSHSLGQHVPNLPASKSMFSTRPALLVVEDLLSAIRHDLKGPPRNPWTKTTSSRGYEDSEETVLPEQK